MGTGVDQRLEAGEDQTEGNTEEPTVIEVNTLNLLKQNPEKSYLLLKKHTQIVVSHQNPQIKKTSTVVQKKKLLLKKSSTQTKTRIENQKQLELNQNPKVSTVQLALLDKTMGAHIHPMIIEMLEPHNLNQKPYQTQGGAIKIPSNTMENTNITCLHAEVIFS